MESFSAAHGMAHQEQFGVDLFCVRGRGIAAFITNFLGGMDDEVVDIGEDLFCVACSTTSGFVLRGDATTPTALVETMGCDVVWWSGKSWKEIVICIYVV